MYLEQFISTEQLATATNRSLRKNRADVMMPTVGFQTDAQATVPTKLLHLSHLSRKDEVTSQLRLCLLKEIII